MRELLVAILLTACSMEPIERSPLGDLPDPSGGDTDPGPDTDPQPDTGEVAGGELRGIWVTRWSWSTAEDVGEIMERTADAGFNTVFFQVRGNFDAYYQSAIEPWASRLTGVLGQSPGWDPLEVAVEAGHARGLEVHAYINVFPFWTGETEPGESEPRHALLEHPDWLVADDDGEPLALNSSYVYASPGNPAVRERVARVAADLAQRYEVDGVHLDYIRYPAPQYSHDQASLDAHSGSDLSWADWQREQVTETARQMYDTVGVPVTASVWGVYENRWGWSGVTEGYHDYYQDSRAFLSREVMDGNIPMIYWPVTDEPGDRLDFATLIADHLAHSSGRHVYAGITAESGEAVAVRCIEAAREAGAPGVVLFDYATAWNNGWLTSLASGPFSEPARPPTMPWRRAARRGR